MLPAMFLVRVALVGAALLVALAAAELALRVEPDDPAYRAFRARAAELEAFSRATERPAPGLRREHIPGATAVLRGVTYRYNAEGLRDDREAPRAKPPGESRVAFLSDSTGAGLLVPQESTCARVMERHLPRTRVLDFSILGADLADLHHLLRHRALAFAPDAVVLVACVNDVHDLRRPGDPQLPENRFQSALAERVRLALWRGGDPPHVRWDVFEDNVRALAALAKQHGLPLVAAIGPVRPTVRAVWAPVAGRMQATFTRAGARFVDLWAVFARREEPLFFAPDEGFAYPEDVFHTTTPGHALMGKALAEALQ